MAFTNKQHRKRYAEDPDYRERKLAKNRVWRQVHREELIADWHEKWSTDDEFRERKRAKARARRLKKYGLTPADYERMWIEQNGVCRICKRKGRRSLCVDHSHTTQKVRSLLCDGCNIGLGAFDDDAERMREGADYLDRANGIALPPCRLLGGAGCAQRHAPQVHATIILRAEVGRFRLG